MSSIISSINAVVKFVQVWGKLLLVVGSGVAGFLYSPMFRQVFLGVAIGAVALFTLEYTNLFPPPQSQYCISPKADPNGPKCMTWVSTDDQRGYGYWTVCKDLQ